MKLNFPILRQLRLAQTQKTTLAELQVWSEFHNSYRHVCYLIEDKIRPIKIKGQTCIMAGVHEVKMRLWGRHFESYQAKATTGLPQATKFGILEVFTKEFKNTLYHTGNTSEDTEGCPLPCLNYKVVNGEFVGIDSTAALIRMLTIPYFELNTMTLPAYVAKYGGKVEIINPVKR